MTKKFKNKMVELTTNRGCGKAKVRAEGFTDPNGNWLWYVRSEAWNRAAKKICQEGDCLMLAKDSADKLGVDKLDVISGVYPETLVAVLSVKRD